MAQVEELEAAASRESGARLAYERRIAALTEELVAARVAAAAHVRDDAPFALVPGAAGGGGGVPRAKAAAAVGAGGPSWRGGAAGGTALQTGAQLQMRPH